MLMSFESDRASSLGWVVGFALTLLLLPSVSQSGALHTGNFVMITRNDGPGYRIVELDANTLAMSDVAVNGHVGWPGGATPDLAVDRHGNLVFTSPAWGIARFDPVTGQDTLIATNDAMGGGTPAGLCLADDGGIYVSMRGPFPRVIRLTADGALSGVVSSGGLLVSPAGLKVGIDGALYVCEETTPGVLTPLSPYAGSVLRVDPGTGAQSLVVAGEPLLYPYQIAVAPDGSLWTVGRGLPNGHVRYVVRTAFPSGPMWVVAGNASGIAIRSDGLTVFGGCTEIHTSCSALYVLTYPSGPQLNGYNGPLAVVPEITTPTTATTWGRLKTLYR
jgi:hypothetical protein